MSLTLDATVGGAASNTYATLLEAQAYFDSRLPLTGWDDADSQEVLLAMATRTLDAMAVPHRTLKIAKDGSQYFYVSRAWTGSPASVAQRLAWPRLGMRDRNGNPLDFAVTSISVANPTVVTTDRPHRLTSGQSVLFVESDSTPTLVGTRVVTVLSTTTFTVPITVTVAGTTGRFAVMPQELKDAEAELAGQLGIKDTTLDNATIVGGITSVKAGSVAVTFREDLLAYVLPSAVLNLMPASWFTEESIESVLGPAEFDVIPSPCYRGIW